MKNSRAPRDWSTAWALPLLLLLTVCVFAGGASRADEALQITVRLSAVLVMAAVFVRLDLIDWTTYRLGLIFALLCAGLPVVQLVPLPPFVWTILPGRALYTHTAELLSIDQPWRPLSLSPDLTIDSVLAVMVPVAGLAAASVIERGDQARIILPAAIVVIAISALLGLLQLASPGNTSLYFFHRADVNSPSGVFANRNHQAALLAIGLPMLAAWVRVWRMVDSKARAPGWIALALVGLIVPMALLTGSRAGLLALVIGTLGAIALLWHRGRDGSVPKEIKIAIGTLLVAVLLLVGLFIAAAGSPGIARLIAADPLKDQRFAYLPMLMRITGDFMPFGTGFGAFDAVFRSYEPDQWLTTAYFNHAHNDFAELAIEGGLPAVGLIIALIVIWLRAGWAVWRAPVQSIAIILGRLGSVAIAIMLATSALDYPLRTPLMGVIGAVCFGWMLLGSKVARDQASSGQ